jgi:short-subunit dehydrogenase
MVSLSDVQSSNSRIASALPPGLVAVFVGATNGIGETTLKQFAKHTRQPRVYFVGRSQEAGDRIAAECKALNAKGEYIFIKADTSLIRTVDDICRDIKSKEESINLLFLSTGTLVAGVGMSMIFLEYFNLHREQITRVRKSV